MNTLSTILNKICMHLYNKQVAQYNLYQDHLPGQSQRRRWCCICDANIAGAQIHSGAPLRAPSCRSCRAYRTRHLMHFLVCLTAHADVRTMGQHLVHDYFCDRRLV